MSEDINIYMDPLENMYTDSAKINIASGLVESVLEEVNRREHHREAKEKEQLEEARVKQKAKVKEPNKEAKVKEIYGESKVATVMEQYEEAMVEEQDREVIVKEEAIVKEQLGESNVALVKETDKIKVQHEEARVKEMHEKAKVKEEHEDAKMKEEGKVKEKLEDAKVAMVKDKPRKAMVKEEAVKEKQEEPKHDFQENVYVGPYEMNIVVVAKVATKHEETQVKEQNDLEHMYLEPDDINIEQRFSESTPEEYYIYVEPDQINVVQGLSDSTPEEDKVKKQLKLLENVTLNIAVTGMTGAGKSSFINAIRGVGNDEKASAPTGVTETTMRPTMYPHPTMPNVKLWDLPGTGSPKFKAKNYLKDVQFDTYDFFIIITSERLKENDITLAKAIKKKKKVFYFLRSKIDNDIRAEQQKKSFDEHRVLSKIREDCQKNLKDSENPKVFLISSFELAKYDFQKLIGTLEKELPEHKRDALVLSLPVYSTDILERKIETFRRATWSAAVASGAIAVAPIPGLSVACDAGILLAFFTRCYYAFGLDDTSLEKLSERMNNPSLKYMRKSALVVAIRKKELGSRELSALVSGKAAVEFACSIVPVIGSAAAAKMSYSATLKLLQTGLQELAGAAREVLKEAGLTNVY